jgi:hypothetical protein
VNMTELMRSDHSYGSPYGRVSAVGLANEIVARLTDTPVILGSGTNSALDLNPSTFPYNKSFYADFSHDNNLVALLAAFGLEWESDLPSQPPIGAIPAHKWVHSPCQKSSIHGLSPTCSDRVDNPLAALEPKCFAHTRFVVSSLVPFAGRYVFERLVDQSGKKYVRIIVNEAVIRLNYAGCGDMGVTQGICELDSVVAAQTFLRQMPSEWDQICYSAPANKTISL